MSGSTRVKPRAVGAGAGLLGGSAYGANATGATATSLQRQYDAAYQEWDGDAHYTIKEFLQDWGKEGYYTKGMRDARVVDSNAKGPAVVVYVNIDSLKSPVALRVDKETLKISFSPESKYPAP